MSAPIAGVLSSLERIVYDAPTLQRRVAAMGHEITAAFQDQELTVVALLDGALFFVADLLRAIPLPIRLYTLTVSSYHGATTSSGRVHLADQLPFDLEARQVLLIDDILDTGLTLATVQDRLRQSCQNLTLRTAVLLRKERPRDREPDIDFVGFDIKDEFVVGYGMDYQGHYRNLPCIGVINPSPLADA